MAGHRVGVEKLHGLPTPLEDGELAETVARVDRLDHRGSTTHAPSWDLLVREEPLEIRVNGAPLAVVMRTPGHDEELVRGFLRTEGIVTDLDQILRIRHCRVVPHQEAEDNVVLADLQIQIDPEYFRRNLFAGSSCGICGKASVEQALRTAHPFPQAPDIPVATLLGVVDQMRDQQVIFRSTGGLHGAAAFDRRGRVLCVREDVGRHNAVDKVVGALGSKHDAVGLAVSGRVSFEIVQKALAARLQTIVAVSAPSSLAVRLARESRMTVVAFARGERAVIYAQSSEGVP